MGAVQRLDFGARLAKAQRTPQGGVRVPAQLTRAGVFGYRRADGSTVRELRPEAEVFSPATLESLCDAPVTDLHPKVMVTPESWRAVVCGTVAEVHRDGDFVAGELAIQDSVVLAAVDRGERSEISCGYRCDVDETPGDGYDAIQRNIRYNHVALGPVGWGRAGRDVALRLDAAYHTLETEQNTMKVRVDGIDYEAGSPEHLQAQAKLDAKHAADVAALVKDRDTQQGRADAAEAQVKSLGEKLKEATDEKHLNERIAKRVVLVADATKVLGAETKFDSMTDQDIMVAVIKKSDESFDVKDRSLDYIKGRYEASLQTRTDTVLDAARAAGTVRVDATDVIETARRKMVDDNRAAATGPLAFTRS